MHLKRAVVKLFQGLRVAGIGPRVHVCKLERVLIST